MGVESSPQEFSTYVHENMAKGFEAPVSIQAGDGCESLYSDERFGFIVVELVNNCAEKDVPSVLVSVSISYQSTTDRYHVEVTDSVQYDPDEVKKIIKSLNSKNPKQFGKKEGKKGGGVGILMAKRGLAKWDGTLQYEQSDDHRIIAVADWSKSAFENTKRKK